MKYNYLLDLITLFTDTIDVYDIRDYKIIVLNSLYVLILVNAFSDAICIMLVSFS